MHATACFLTPRIVNNTQFACFFPPLLVHTVLCLEIPIGARPCGGQGHKKGQVPIDRGKVHRRSTAKVSHRLVRLAVQQCIGQFDIARPGRAVQRRQARLILRTDNKKLSNNKTQSIFKFKYSNIQNSKFQK